MTDQLPAFLQGDRRQIGAQSVEGMGAPPVPYISIDGGRFTLVDATNNEFPVMTYGPIFTQRQPDGSELGIAGSPVGPYLDAVLVDVNEHMSKTYYIKPYDPHAARFMPPDCWSDNGIAPSTGALHPQCERCDICPKNDWGSKVNNLGNEVKACDDVKKLAWMIPALGNGMVFLMRLKGSSHKFWRNYVEKVVKQSIGTRALDPTDIVTRIYFEPIQGQTGFLNFHWVRLIDQTDAGWQDAIWKARSTDSMIGRLDKPRVLALPAPGPQAQPQLQQPMQPVFQPPQQQPQYAPPPPPAPPQQPTFQPQPATQPVYMPQQQPQQQPTFVPQQPGPQQQPQQQAQPQPTPAPRRRRKAAADPQQPAGQPQQPGFAMQPQQQPSFQLQPQAQQTQPAFVPPNPTQPSFVQQPGPQQAQQTVMPPPPPHGMAQGNPNVPSDLSAALADALKPLT